MQTLKLAFEANDRDAVQISIQTLAQLRTMLMNEAKLRFGETPETQNEPCSLLHMIEDLKMMLRSSIDSFGLKLAVVSPDSLHYVTINTDRGMLMSMLCNLMSNAIKHSRSDIIVELYVVECCLRIQVIEFILTKTLPFRWCLNRCMMMVMVYRSPFKAACFSISSVSGLEGETRALGSQA